jgi:hypothetical protein
VGAFNNDAEENSFIRNLHLLSFSKEIAETFNLVCGMCEKSFFTSTSGINVCSECHDHIQELIEEFKNDC